MENCGSAVISVTSFLRGQLANHDTPPAPQLTRSKPDRPLFLDDRDRLPNPRHYTPGLPRPTSRPGRAATGLYNRKLRTRLERPADPNDSAFPRVFREPRQLGPEARAAEHFRVDDVGGRLASGRAQHPLG